MSDSVIGKITRRAMRISRRILLAESEDPRVLRAAQAIRDRNYARPVLLGREEEVLRSAAQLGVDLRGIEILDHTTDPKRGEYVQRLYDRRKHKGMSLQDADALLSRGVYYGGMMVGDGRVDGMVAGSNCPTSDTVRSALFGVGLEAGNKTACACSLMNTVVGEIGVGGSLIFADTGVLPDPTVEQLADIAIAAAGVCKALLDVEPCVAMLSFSTKGSARSPAVQKVVQATRLVQSRRGDLNIDGELQVDAAVIPEVAQRKASGSSVAGRANTLIFPDLAAGNIACKLVERLGKATALGPLLTGLAKPVNDLSRGCSVEDIVLITAITASQCH